LNIYLLLQLYIEINRTLPLSLFSFILLALPRGIAQRRNTQRAITSVQ
jgi:hypothetical protein